MDPFLRQKETIQPFTKEGIEAAKQDFKTNYEDIKKQYGGMDIPEPSYFSDESYIGDRIFMYLTPKNQGEISLESVRETELDNFFEDNLFVEMSSDNTIPIFIKK